MRSPGLQLRQIRERLGLTYREVEKASYELALKRGRPDFILHLSRRRILRIGEWFRACTNCIAWLPWAMGPTNGANPATWSTVLIDTHLRRFEDSNWQSEYDRPLYFVELHEGFRCGWFVKRKSRLVMQPHPLSRCLPEEWQTPQEAETVGQVIGMVSYLNEP